MFKKISILLLLISAACATKESPVVYFSNVSPKPIKDIQCKWGRHAMNLPILDPGDSRSQSFYIRGDSDFFDDVSISWRTEDGDRIIREFSFKENNMPSFSDETTYNYVQFYIDQDEMEIVSSDAPDLPGKTRKMERMMVNYKTEYMKTHSKAHTSLITLSPQEFSKDRSVPTWLSTSY
jgi:hypothetical protein